MKRSLLILALIAVAVGMTACTKPRVIVRPQIVEVPRYIRAPIDPLLTAPLTVTWPDGLCWHDAERVLCNGQLAALLLDYREALDQANADRARLRAGAAGVAP